MKKMEPTFWVTNMSPMNVTLADLALNIKAYSSVNLLDKRHYKYTLEQLLKSKESGSLFKKRDKIRVRDIPPPDPEKSKIPIVYSSVIPDRVRSLFNIKDEEYEELRVSEEDQKKQDEIYAQENADLAELDTQRSVINQKKV
jgi:predicted transcriptional regulator